MAISTKKKLGWLVFSAGAGLFAIISIEIIDAWVRGYRWTASSRNEALGLGFGSTCLMIVSLATLHRLYRLEPAQHRGKWHVSLADCMVLALVAALWMLVWRTGSPQSFFPTGAIVSLVAAIWLLIAMLSAARQGFADYPAKLIFGFGLALKSYGYLCWGAFLILSVFVLLGTGLAELINYWNEALITPIGQRGYYSVLFARLSLGALPAGYALCAIARIENRKAA